jgi:hypothetical protein
LLKKKPDAGGGTAGGTALQPGWEVQKRRILEQSMTWVLLNASVIKPGPSLLGSVSTSQVVLSLAKHPFADVQ